MWRHHEPVSALDCGPVLRAALPCMTGGTGTRIEIVLRRADRVTLGAAVELRKQPLDRFLVESLEGIAADLRQAPRFRLTRQDVLARQSEAEAPEQGARADRPATRQWRWRRLPAAGSK
jgi:hypothetical protein